MHYVFSVSYVNRKANTVTRSLTALDRRLTGYVYGFGVSQISIPYCIQWLAGMNLAMLQQKRKKK